MTTFRSIFDKDQNNKLVILTPTGISLILQKFKLFKQNILKFLAPLLLVEVLSNFRLLLRKVSLKLIFPADTSKSR